MRKKRKFSVPTVTKVKKSEVIYKDGIKTGRTRGKPKIYTEEYMLALKKSFFESPQPNISKFLRYDLNMPETVIRGSIRKLTVGWNEEKTIHLGEAIHKGIAPILKEEKQQWLNLLNDTAILAEDEIQISSKVAKQNLLITTFTAIMQMKKEMEAGEIKPMDFIRAYDKILKIIETLEKLEKGERISVFSGQADETYQKIQELQSVAKKVQNEQSELQYNPSTILVQTIEEEKEEKPKNDYI